MSLVLSHYEVEPILKARAAGLESAETSPDLGLSRVTVTIASEGATFPSGELVSWERLAEISKSDTKCFLLDGEELSEIRVFSEETGRVCSLYPTGGAPTMVIGGFPMHRIKGTDPHKDTLEKIRAAAPMAGRVLDTTTGLGYTAIEAARSPLCTEVITVELDPGSLEIARQNPWSRELFSNPKISQIVGDSFNVIKTFPDGRFTRIIHDPPTFSLAGDLYSGAFYRECYRVLSHGGRLFHYVGNLESSAGSTVSKGAIRRLKESGFERVVQKPQAFGVLAYK